MYIEIERKNRVKLSSKYVKFFLQWVIEWLTDNAQPKLLVLESCSSARRLGTVGEHTKRRVPDIPTQNGKKLDMRVRISGLKLFYHKMKANWIY